MIDAHLQPLLALEDGYGIACDQLEALLVMTNEQIMEWVTKDTALLEQPKQTQTDLPIGGEAHTLTGESQPSNTVGTNGETKAEERTTHIPTEGTPGESLRTETPNNDGPTETDGQSSGATLVNPHTEIRDTYKEKPPENQKQLASPPNGVNLSTMDTSKITAFFPKQDATQLAKPTSPPHM